MKNQFLLLITFALLINCEGLYSQKKSEQIIIEQKELELDPRQFIDIYEVRKFKEKIPIWNWTSNSGEIEKKRKRNEFKFTNQKREIVDENSIVRIEFNKKSLAKTINFKGNIYIQAVISGGDGAENPVEVLPYTKIGEDRALIGIPTRPAKEIAEIFVNLIIESLDFIVDYGKIRGNKEDTEIYRDTTNRTEIVTPNKVQLEQTLKKLELLIDYIDFFQQSGENAENAFLSLIGFDYILLDKLVANLKRNKEAVSKELNTEPKTNIDLEKITQFFDNAVIDLKRLASIKGTPTYDFIFYNNIFSNEEIISFITGFDLGYVYDEIEWVGEGNEQNGRLNYGFTGNGVDWGRQYFPLNSRTYSNIMFEGKVKIIDKVALLASQKIFIDLDYATIDLLKEGGKDGDILYLNLILADKSKRSSNVQSSIREKVYPVGRFKLRRTGWKPDVTDSFFLINRIDEPNNNNSNISPSNFKGAPGVTLSATRYKDGNPKRKILNFFEPSIGIDVSYVDFDTEKDIEIGVGATLGLFKNKIFAIYGINLNNTGDGEESPFYFGVGFSFAKLGGKLLK